MAVRKIDGLDGNFHVGARFVTLYALETVTAENAVALDVNDTTNGRGNQIRTADANAAGDVGPQSRGAICGIVDATATLGAGATTVEARVQVAGLRAGVNVEAAVVQGDKLVAGDTAGRLRSLQSILVADPVTNAQGVLAAQHTVLAIAMTDANVNAATVWLLDPMQLSDD